MTLCLREMMPGCVVMRWGGKTWEFPDYGTSWRVRVHRLFPRSWSSPPAPSRPMTCGY